MVPDLANIARYTETWWRIILVQKNQCLVVGVYAGFAAVVVVVIIVVVLVKELVFLF